MSRFFSIATALVILLKCSHFVLAQNDGSQTTFLDDFVFSDESLSQYSYFHASEYDYVTTNPVTGIGYSAYVLNITSGEWLTGNCIVYSLYGVGCMYHNMNKFIHAIPSF